MSVYDIMAWFAPALLCLASARFAQKKEDTVSIIFGAPDVLVESESGYHRGSGGVGES